MGACRGRGLAIPPKNGNCRGLAFAPTGPQVGSPPGVPLRYPAPRNLVCARRTSATKRLAASPRVLCGQASARRRRRDIACFPSFHVKRRDPNVDRDCFSRPQRWPALMDVVMGYAPNTHPSVTTAALSTAALEDARDTPFKRPSGIHCSLAAPNLVPMPALPDPSSIHTRRVPARDAWAE